jgi:hypothetical protein
MVILLMIYMKYFGVKTLKTYGAIMALAGLFVDCTCESQPSSWAFSCGPIKTAKLESAKQCTTDNHMYHKALTEPK